jgi:hypothetical protein
MNDAHLKIVTLSRLTPEELRDTEPILFLTLRTRADEQLRAAMLRHFEGASAAVREVVSCIVLSSGGDGSRDTRRALLEAFEAKDVPAEVAQEGLARLRESDGVGRVEDPLRPDVPLGANPLVAAELARARTIVLGESARVGTARVEAIVEQGLTVETLHDAALDGLVVDGALSTDEATRLGLATTVWRLAGDLNVTRTMVRRRFARLGDRPARNLRDLARLDRSEVRAAVRAAKPDLAAGSSIDDYADQLRRQLARLYPTEALLAALPRPERDGLASDLKALAVLRRRNPRVLGAAFDTLDTKGLRPQARAEARPAHERLRRLVNTSRGLRLDAILDDPELHADTSIARVLERLGWLDRLRTQNPGVELLALDYSPGSADVKALDFHGLATAEQGMVVDTLKSHQRIHAITADVDDAQAILAAGYDSVLPIARTSTAQFARTTGLGEHAAAQYRATARTEANTVATMLGAVIDVVVGGFNHVHVGNLGTDIDDFLRRLPGYETLFGALGFCNCGHCSSILSPAAYFVDLMSFVEGNVSDAVFTGPRRNHVLSLRQRRPDLWTLPLTCDNTDTRIPALDVVNEILENHVALQRGLPPASLTNRGAVERVVYERTLSRGTPGQPQAVHSFRQPYVLPLEKLHAFLGHFDRPLDTIARTMEAPRDAIAAAALRASAREHGLISRPNATLGFLRQVYGIRFDVPGGVATPFDVQLLLAPTGLTRVELGELLATHFVQPPGPRRVEIRAGKRDVNSVQNDIETIHNLTTPTLDRIHRFTRLRHRLGWTIGETDLAFEALTSAGLAEGLDAAALAHLADIVALQQRFAISVEETLALSGAISGRPIAPGGRSLMDRLFNLPPFERLDGPWPPPTEVTFVHPSFRSAGADPADNTLNRLLAGLRVSDESLSLLISLLAEPLGADLAAANEDGRGFAITAANLGLLYGHARLAALLSLPVSELFQLVDHLHRAGVLVERFVRHLGDVMVLLDWFDWQRSSGYSLDDLGYITRGQVLAPTAHPHDPATVVDGLIEAVRADRALVFADTVLAYLTDATEQYSRDVIGAAVQAGAVEAIPNGAYRLAATFDPTGPIAVPAGNPISATEARTELLKYHASRVIPHRLAARLGRPVATIESLIAMLGVDLGAPAVASALNGAGPPDELVSVVDGLLPLAVLFGADVFDSSALDFVRTHNGQGGFAIDDFAAVTLTGVRRVTAYTSFTDTSGEDRFAPQQSPVDPADVRQVLGDFDPAAGFANADVGVVARVLRSEVGLVRTLIAHVTAPTDAPAALRKLALVLELARHLGVGGETLRQMVSDQYAELVRASDAVVGAFRAKYDDEREWNEKVEPYDDILRASRRDALVDHLLHPAVEFTSPSDLYHHFLVDVAIGGCARTSRLVSGISSVQLYVHRCLTNLEQDRRDPADPQHVAVDPARIPRDEWAWRKNYRVWEANRKVFLYPENYLEPGLRDDKTPLFEQLESTLLQQDVNEQTVLDAYAAYLVGFEELASLTIAGSYHDDVVGGQDILHLFGATPSDPPLYYYRTVENLRASERDATRPVSWAPWRKIDVQIPTRRVAPIVYRNQLHVFWHEITTTTRSRVDAGTSSFDGYKHALALKYTTLRLDGTWTAPQRVTIDGILDDGTILEPASRPEPRDGHTLTGYQWEQPYPGAVGHLAPLHVAFPGRVTPNVPGFEPEYGIVDLRRRQLGWRSTHYDQDQTGIPGLLYAVPSDSDDHVALVHSHSRDLDPVDLAYALASRHLERARLEPWVEYGLVDIGAFERNLDRPAMLAVPRAGELAVVNGRFSEVTVDVDGDVFLLSYVGADPNLPYVLRRIGTTLAETVAGRLFTEGIDGLLETGFQLRLHEVDSPLDVRERVRDDTVVLDAAQAATIDYRGAFGVYYRELYFHIPFLLADHLNSQGNFAAAQRWYHYLFDPTAADPASGGLTPSQPAQAEQWRRDRPWRYREFRNRTLPVLRELLRDGGAIAAYRNDPFNPHAIARLRLSAYQKSIVMKYIDNLLDWGDSLFAAFTTESLNEASLLYQTALDVLGERPAEVGGCGEGAVEPRDYATIAPLLAGDSPFLIELETAYRGAGNLRIGTRRELAYRYAPSATSLGTAFEDGARANGAVFRGYGWQPTRTVAWEHPPGNINGNPDAEDGRPARESRLVDVPIRGFDSPSLGGFQRAQDFPLAVATETSPVFCIPPNRDLLDYWDRVESRLDNIRSCRDITGATRSPALFAPPIDPRLLVRALAAGLSLEDVLNTLSGELPPYRFEFLIAQAKTYATTVQAGGAALLGALERRDAEELTQLRATQQQHLLKLTTSARESELRAAEEGIVLVERQEQAARDRRNHFQGLIDGRLSPAERTQQVSRHFASVSSILAANLSGTAGILHLLPQLGSFFAMKWGGAEAGDSAKDFAKVLEGAARDAEIISTSAGLEASFQRRAEEWALQRDVADHELKGLEKQRVVAEIRRDIAQTDLDVHLRSVEQLEEEYAFHAEKFSSLGLYTTLSATLQRIHREAYNSAFAVARLAEQAFRFERSDEVGFFVRPDNWDATRAGLLAGERLLIDLQAMERRFLETNHRSMEVDQSFSLRQLDPAALIALRRHGSCTFGIGELPFDLVYPGHYRRRIKSVRLTIPCVTGPYTNVAATLTLLESRIRVGAELGDGNRVDMTGLRLEPLQRTVAIATSSGRNDGGVFELSFRDERYLPFEGAGAISQWQLELPRHFRPFDYDTISDVIVHISYVAEHNRELRDAIENIEDAVEGQLLHTLRNAGLTRVLSLRHDFSTAFHRLLHSPLDTSVPIEISELHFPAFLRYLQGSTIAVRRASLALEVGPGRAANDLAVSVDGTTISQFQADNTVAGLLAADVSAMFAPGIYGTHEFVVTDAGRLAPDAPAPGDQSAIDETELRDVLLYVEYVVT